MFSLRALFLLSAFALAATPTHAGQLAGAGERLQLLKKIQGRWQSDCFAERRDGKRVYQRTSLTFSFTHLQRSEAVFTDANCAKRQADTRSRYRFTLGDAIISGDGQKAFAVNFTVAGEAAELPRLHAANLIDYHSASGELLLGEPVPGAKPQQRLSRLNHRQPYRRP